MAKSIVESATEVVLDLTEKTPIQVLHVDDEPSLLKAAKQILEMHDLFQVETASSVEEATEKMKKKTFDVIVSDYVMPRKDGLQFLRELREEDNNIPFIIFTGKGREEVAIKALNLGADQYLNKGGSPETVYGELAHGIRKVVERKRAQEMLEESEERHRTLLDMANMLIQSVNAEGRFVYVNKEWKKVLGYTEKDLQKITMMDVIRKDQHKHCMDVFRQVMEDKSVRGVGTVFVAKDGREIMVSGNAMPRFKDGKFASTVGFFADITERKKAEERLRASEEKYRGLFENAKDVTLTMDLKGKITSINKAAVEYGFKKGEIIGKNQLKFVPKKYWSRILKELVQISRGKTVEGNIEINTPKGKKAADYRSAPIIIDDRVVGVQTNLRDVTEHKGIEERYRDLVEKEKDIIYTLDDKGNITFASPAVKTTLGYQPEEVIGKNFMVLVPEEWRKKAEADFSNTLRTGEITADTVLLDKNGQPHFVEYSSTVIKEGNKVVGTRGIVRDITERKKTEEALGVSEEKYRNLFENARDVILTLDLKGNVTSINKSVTRYGFKEEEIIGKNLRKFVPKKYWLRLLQSISKISHGEPARGEIEINTPKGKIITEYQSNPISRGKKVIGIQSTLRNITERKHFEERLSALNTYSQKLNMTESMEAIYRLTLDAMEKTLGFEIAFFMVVDKDMLCVVDQRGYPGALSIKLPLDGTQRGVSVKVARTGKPIIVPDAEKEDDWVEFWPGIHSGLDVPVKIGRKVLGVIGVESKTLNAFGEKDRKLLEILASHAATAMSNLEYISQLKRTENTLKATLEKLETMNEKLSVVGKFTRHDARNKLSTITMNAFLAKQKLASDHEALEYLSEIESVCGQVERIFDFARIYEKLGMEELTYMDVEKNLEEACMLFSDLHGIKVVNDCRGLTVLADSLLRQLLYNLIDNSLKHGEKVSQIRMHYKEVGKDQLKMVYEDDGVGIPQAEKEKIFKEGYGKGTGYGLYLIRKICEVYSWTIQETGEQGKRAQFTITIPKTGENGKMNYKLH